jgi:hypothetical protein
MPSPTRANDPAGIAQRILVLRGQRVLLDADLAALYGVTSKRLNEQVKRNRARFPDDFVFHLEINDLQSLRSQFATLEKGAGPPPQVSADGLYRARGNHGRNGPQ